MEWEWAPDLGGPVAGDDWSWPWTEADGPASGSRAVEPQLLQVGRPPPLVSGCWVQMILSIWENIDLEADHISKCMLLRARGIQQAC